MQVLSILARRSGLILVVCFQREVGSGDCVYWLCGVLYNIVLRGGLYLHLHLHLHLHLLPTTRRRAGAQCKKQKFKFLMYFVRNKTKQWLLVGSALLITCYTVHFCCFTKL